MTIGLAIMALRTWIDLQLFDELGPTGGALSLMGSLTISAFLWLFLSWPLYVFLMAKKEGKKKKATIAMFAALPAILVTGFLFWSTLQTMATFKAASDPATSPSELAALATEGGTYQYSIDNRLARNPSTPVHTLILLSKREKQIGTLLNLAENPSTPNDILIKFSYREYRDWNKSMYPNLRGNPKVKRGELVFGKSRILHKNPDWEQSK